jgi:YD repeat-containing protein
MLIERAGLRGPVKLCVEDEETREYDRNGKILESRGVDVDGLRWGTRWTYESDERLVRTTRIVRDGTYGASGGVIRRGPLHGTSVEQVYSYDQAGRLISLTNGHGGRTDFRYDEQGRKTKVVTITPQPQAISGIPESSAVIDFAECGDAIRLKGGSITTRYNDRDQPAEVQIRDCHGTIVQRVVRSYDTDGRLLKEDLIFEGIGEMTLPKELSDSIPQEQHATVLAGLRESFEAIRRLGSSHHHERSYSYDDQNRVAQISRHSGSRREDVAITYNDHGDKDTELTTYSEEGGQPTEFHRNADGSWIPTKFNSQETPRQIEIRYTYQYDAHSNWTTQTTTYAHRPAEPFIRRRTLTYY